MQKMTDGQTDNQHFSCQIKLQYCMA